MTPLEIVLLILLWIILGLFICYKANWFDNSADPSGVCVITVILAPIVFLWDFVNRFFIQKWH